MFLQVVVANYCCKLIVVPHKLLLHTWGVLLMFFQTLSISHKELNLLYIMIVTNSLNLTHTFKFPNTLISQTILESQKYSKKIQTLKPRQSHVSHKHFNLQTHKPCKNNLKLLHKLLKPHQHSWTHFFHPQALNLFFVGFYGNGNTT